MYTTRQTAFISTTFILLSLSTLTVAARFYCRSKLVKRVSADDWLMLIALVLAWVLGIENYFHVEYGTGKHIKDVNMSDLIPTLKSWYAYQLIYPLCLCFVKLSILVFYRRLIPSHGYQLAIKSTIGFVVAWTITIVIVCAFECPHPSMAWSLKFPHGCNNLSAQYYAAASINILQDIIILLLPLPVLGRLHLPRNKRIALIAIFSVGSISVMASLARLHSLWLYQHTKDVSWDAIYILLWSQIEINVAIICASVPALKPLFRSVFEATQSYLNRSKETAENNSNDNASKQQDHYEPKLATIRIVETC